MATLNISLPEPMRKFIDQQIAKGGYATASEYLRDLIRQAEKRASQEALEAELRKGLDSGPGIVADDKFWAQRRSKLLAGHASRGKSKRRAL